MKRIYDNIEQQYKNRFDSYQHDFDEAAMWQGLDAAMPQNPQPKIAAFALAGAFMVSILAGIFWMNQYTSQLMTQGNTLTEELSEMQHSEVANNILVKEDLTANASAIAINPSDFNTKADAQTFNKQTWKAKNKTAVAPQNTLTNNLSSKHSKPFEQKTAQAAMGASITTPQINANSHDYSLAALEDKANTKMDFAPIKAKKQAIARIQNKLSLLPTISSNASMSTPNLLQKEMTLRDGDLDCPLFGGKKRTKIKGSPFIDIYGEGNMSSVTVESQNTETNAYETTWNNTDTPLGSYELGVMLGYEFDNGLYAALGLEYQKTVEKLEYQQTIIERITVWSDEAYFYVDDAGNQVFVGDSVTTQSTYKRSVISGKEHTIMNLPIMLGYKLKMNRFNVGIFGGMNINLSHKFEGKIIDESNSFVTLNEDNYETVYKNKLDASPFAGFHLGYSMSNHAELYFNPTFRFHSKSWMQDDYSLSAKYQLAGVRLGLRYKL